MTMQEFIRKSEQKPALIVGDSKKGILRIPVRLIDHRSVFDRDDYLIAPTSGDGQTWVSESRLSFEDSDAESPLTSRCGEFRNGKWHREGD